MNRRHRLVAWFSDLDRYALAEAGGKGANLAEMTRLGLSVPPGFVVTTAAYRAHLDHAGLRERIAARVGAVAGDDRAAAEQAAADVGAWINAQAVPVAVVDAVGAACRALASHRPGTPGQATVAVRSSATVEDLPDASFAGQQASFLHVPCQPDMVLAAVRRCWASLWTARALLYRTRMGFNHSTMELAVVVQAMVAADVAGVLFTANPVTGVADEFVVTANYGLGESVVGGLVTPDTYRLTPTGKLRQRTLGTKERQIVGDVTSTKVEDVPPGARSRYCLTDRDLIGLAELGRSVTAHYGTPQDIEWALAAGRLYLVQTRPITTAALASRARRPSRVRRAVLERAAAFVAEYYPQPPTPMDAAGIAAVLSWFYLDRLGIRRPDPDTILTEQPDVFFLLPTELVAASAGHRHRHRSIHPRGRHPARG